MRSSQRSLPHAARYMLCDWWRPCAHGWPGPSGRAGTARTTAVTPVNSQYFGEEPFAELVLQAGVGLDGVVTPGTASQPRSMPTKRRRLVVSYRASLQARSARLNRRSSESTACAPNESASDRCHVSGNTVRLPRTQFGPPNDHVHRVKKLVASRALGSGLEPVPKHFRRSAERTELHWARRRCGDGCV